MQMFHVLIVGGIRARLAQSADRLHAPPSPQEGRGACPQPVQARMRVPAVNILIIIAEDALIYNR